MKLFNLWVAPYSKNSHYLFLRNFLKGHRIFVQLGLETSGFASLSGNKFQPNANYSHLIIHYAYESVKVVLPIILLIVLQFD